MVCHLLSAYTILIIGIRGYNELRNSKRNGKGLDSA